MISGRILDTETTEQLTDDAIYQWTNNISWIFIYFNTFFLVSLSVFGVI